MGVVALSCTEADSVELAAPQTALTPVKLGGSEPELMHHQYCEVALGKPPVAV
jgi:hypothetical protein